MNKKADETFGYLGQIVLVLFFLAILLAVLFAIINPRILQTLIEKVF